MNIAIWIFTVIATFCFMEFIAWFSHKYIMHGFMWFLHKDHHKKDHKSWFERNDMFFLQYAAFNVSDNNFTAPKFLLKSANTASVLKQNSLAKKYYKSILEDFPKSPESFYIDIQIEKNSSK